MSEVPWSTYVESNSNREWERISCNITKIGLTQALESATQGKTLRLASQLIPRDVLLCSDILLIDNNLVGLNVIANRDPLNKAKIFFESILVSERPLGNNLRASLVIGEYDWVVDIDRDGRAAFPSFPVSSLIDSHNNQISTDLQLTITRL